MNIIWINGMPRSGTSWLSQIFDSHPDVRFKLAPLFSYRFKNAVTIGSSTENWLTFFNNVYQAQDPFLDQTEKRISGDYPVFINKYPIPNFLVIKDTRYHNLTPRLLEILPSLKFVHIIRNPCAVINSWINTYREFGKKGCKAKSDWKTGVCRKTGPEEFWGFDDWVALSRLYLKLQEKYPDQIFTARYEDLVKDPISSTKAMFAFTQLELHEETIKFLDASQNIELSDPYSVYKTSAVKDKWKHELDKKIIEQIFLELKGTSLERYLDD